MFLDMVNTNSILNFLGQNFGQIGKTFKAQDSPEVFLFVGSLMLIGAVHMVKWAWQFCKTANCQIAMWSG
jgi:hypothetical protein